MVIRDEETREMPHLGDIKSDGGQFAWIDCVFVCGWLRVWVEKEDWRRKTGGGGGQPLVSSRAGIKAAGRRGIKPCFHSLVDR